MVGMTRFELATPATRTRCATRLRYIPTTYSIIAKLAFCSGALPLSQNNSLDCFARQSATSRKLFARPQYTPKQIVCKVIFCYSFIL